MKRFTVILKNGKEFTFDALEVNITYDAVTEEVEKIDWCGARGTIPLHILPSEIVAIYYEKLPEDGEGE